MQGAPTTEPEVHERKDAHVTLGASSKDIEMLKAQLELVTLQVGQMGLEVVTLGIDSYTNVLPVGCHVLF